MSLEILSRYCYSFRLNILFNLLINAWILNNETQRAGLSQPTQSSKFFVFFEKPLKPRTSTTEIDVKDVCCLRCCILLTNHYWGCCTQRQFIYLSCESGHFFIWKNYTQKFLKNWLVRHVGGEAHENILSILLWAPSVVGEQHCLVIPERLVASQEYMYYTVTL